jgi:hypothetical protein
MATILSELLTAIAAEGAKQISTLHRSKASSRACSISSILTIEFQCFAKNLTSQFQKRFATLLFKIHARNLFNPPIHQAPSRRINAVQTEK